MPDWIDELVEWQIQQGIRRGEYKPQPSATTTPPAVRSVSYSVLDGIRRLTFGRR
ncbi:hypothetical protein [Nocardia asiatica]|uniref:hypothetical protein n=1 Tax=Nocardia asiatica TaxID=209252 RepID=UPI00245439A8|nr:hypothetical protein [Nocardia asiatica]